MEDNKPVVINLYGGPGAGKTTLALKITAHLKEEYNGRVEYVPEYARELIFQTKDQVELEHKLSNQRRITREQAERLDNAIKYNKADIIVTDSPLDLGKIYMTNLADKEIVEHIISTSKESYKEINFFINRNEDKEFDQLGRVHTLKESKRLDERILKELNHEYKMLNYDDDIRKISKILKQELNQPEMFKANNHKQVNLNELSVDELSKAFDKLDNFKLFSALCKFEKSELFATLNKQNEQKALKESYDEMMKNDNIVGLINNDIGNIIEEKISLIKEGLNMAKASLKNIER